MTNNSNNTYFLDTNICSYIIKNINDDIVYKLSMYDPAQIKIPSIVKGELYFGAHNNPNKFDELVEKVKFFVFYNVVSFDEEASEIYGKVKSKLKKGGNIIGDNDIIIAATVLSHNGILITNDKHFERIENLKIENWFK